MKNNKVTIFTDGSSRGNPGRGGWSALIIFHDDSGQINLKEIGGREDMTTNNRMEIKAAIQGLSSLKEKSEVTLYTDSSYLINGITKWVSDWKKNDWKTKTKKDVLNVDLWEKLDEVNDIHDVSWKYVGGHIGVKGNERCDEIATKFADNEDVQLYSGPLSGYDHGDILNVSFDEEKLSQKEINKNKSVKNKGKAYSYVSKVGGKVEFHKTWADCEKRVKGVSGAKFKKSFSQEDEANIVREFL